MCEAPTRRGHSLLVPPLESVFLGALAGPPRLTNAAEPIIELHRHHGGRLQPFSSILELPQSWICAFS